MPNTRQTFHDIFYSKQIYYINVSLIFINFLIVSSILVVRGVGVVSPFMLILLSMLIFMSNLGGGVFSGFDRSVDTVRSRTNHLSLLPCAVSCV